MCSDVLLPADQDGEKATPDKHEHGGAEALSDSRNSCGENPSLIQSSLNILAWCCPGALPTRSRERGSDAASGVHHPAKKQKDEPG